MKKKILLLIAICSIFFTSNVFAATCPLGKEVTEDLANILKIIQIIGPILVVVVTIIEVTRTISKGDIQGESKKLGNRLFKRIIYCIVLFFVPVLVQVGAKIAGIDASSCDLSNPSDNNYKIITTSKETLSTTKTKTKKKSSNNDTGSSSSSSSNSTATGNGGEDAKTYKKIHYLGTLKVKKDHTLDSGSYTYRVGQSFCVTDKYIITANIKLDNSADKLSVFSKSTGKLIKQYTMYARHANGMTCNESTGYLYTVTGSTSFTRATLDNIAKKTTIKKVKGPVGATGIAYDPITQKYILSHGHYVDIYDTNMKKRLKRIKKIEKDVAQDVGAYNGVIYVVRDNFGNAPTNTKNASSARNSIDLYRESDGKYIGSYVVAVAKELESIDFDNNGKMYLFFNQNGTSKSYSYTSTLSL